jgi:hypothetical protein
LPWTVSHAAAVLPFRRWCPARLSFGALVVGSMTPDLGYYLGLTGIARFAHTAPGLIAVDLPAGFLLIALLGLMRELLVVPLPQPHRDALCETLEFLAGAPGWRRAASLAFSVVLGAATHAAWDSFTHAGSLPVTRIDWLQRELFAIGSWRVPAYNFLQHASTLFGIVVLAIAYRSWLKSGAATRARSAGAAETARWWILAAIAAAGALAAAAWIAAGLRSGVVNLQSLVVQAVFVATNLMVFLYLAAALAWRRFAAN